MKSPLAVSPRFPALRSSEQGESAPKARLRSVVDGNKVNIPRPLSSMRWGDGVRKMIRVLDIPVCESRRKAGKSAFGSSSQNIDSPREKKSSEVLPRKASKW